MTDFIEFYDNALSDEWCNKYIDYFDTNAEFRYGRDVLYEENFRQTLVEDSALDMLSNFEELSLYSVMRPFMRSFWPCYEKYVEKYSILKNMDKQDVYELKIQKTEPSQGYHVWHTEKMARKTQQRVAVLMCYLNDVEEGGETEFLYQHKRIQPKKGRMLIWPASFTHVHRGNPPISGNKYIITGWIEF
tara:strand:- start:286 stop:852 length:567 start_codon:yes stop_codon:yes gene_type:complete